MIDKLKSNRTKIIVTTLVVLAGIGWIALQYFSLEDEVPDLRDLSEQGSTEIKVIPDPYMYAHRHANPGKALRSHVNCQDDIPILFALGSAGDGWFFKAHSPSECEKVLEKVQERIERASTRATDRFLERLHDKARSIQRERNVFFNISMLGVESIGSSTAFSAALSAPIVEQRDRADSQPGGENDGATGMPFDTKPGHLAVSILMIISGFLVLSFILYLRRKKQVHASGFDESPAEDEELNAPASRAPASRASASRASASYEAAQSVKRATEPIESGRRHVENGKWDNTSFLSAGVLLGPLFALGTFVFPAGGFLANVYIEACLTLEGTAIALALAVVGTGAMLRTGNRNGHKPLNLEGDLDWSSEVLLQDLPDLEIDSDGQNLLIGLGTYACQTAEQLLSSGELPTGTHAVLVDTNRAIKDVSHAAHHSNRVTRIHLQFDPAGPIPDEVPTPHPEAGPEGAAYDASYGYLSAWQLVNGNNRYKIDRIERLFMGQQPQKVVVICSTAGGTGKGARPPFLSYLSGVLPSTHVVYVIHPFNFKGTEMSSAQLLNARQPLHDMTMGTDRLLMDAGPNSAQIRNFITGSPESTQSLARWLFNGRLTEWEGQLVNLRGNVGLAAGKDEYVTAILQTSVQDVASDLARELIRIFREEAGGSGDSDKGESLSTYESSSPPARVRHLIDKRDVANLKSSLDSEARSKVDQEIREFDDHITHEIARKGRLGEIVGALPHLRQHFVDKLVSSKTKERKAREQYQYAMGWPAILREILAYFQPKKFDRRITSHRYLSATYRRRYQQRMIAAVDQWIHRLEEPLEASEPTQFNLPPLADERGRSLLTAALDALVTKDSPERAIRDLILNEHPEAILLALRESLPEALAFDVHVDTETAPSGMLVESPFSEQDMKGVIGEYFDLQDAEFLAPREPGQIMIIRYVAISGLSDLPGAHRLYADQQADKIGNEDFLRYTKRTAADIFPPPFRSQRGLRDKAGELDTDRAALIFAMAYVTPGALRLEEAFAHLEVGPPFQSIEEIAKKFPVSDEVRIHHGFWNDWFASNREAAGRRLGRLKEGELAAEDHRSDRFKRAQSFVGTRRLARAFATLHDQVRMADTQWGA